MKKSTTKRALFLSFVSMFLCFTMLLGTTYAWFTDSVTSATNTIVAGNLDVELKHTNANVSDTKVDAGTKLFTEVEKWEPGAMVWEKFSVENAGNLALKYQFSLNADNATVVNDVAGNPVSFSEMLKVAFLPATAYPNFTPSRDAVKTLDASVWSDLESFVEPGELAEGEKDIYTVVIYWMPSDNDNLFNMNVADVNGNKGKVSVDLGVKLFATQVEAEKDSFDEFYDKDAAFPKVLETVEVKKGVEQTVSTPYGSVTFATDANTTATDVTVSIEQKDVTEGGNFVIDTDEGAKIFDISVKDNNGDSVDAGFNFFVGKNLDVIGFIHYPEQGAPEDLTSEIDYNVTTGYISFDANNGYSPFVITYKYEGGLGTETIPYVIANENQLKAAVNESACYVLAKDITVNAGVSFVVPAGLEVTLDLNGKTITGLDNATGSFGLFTNKGTFTVKDSVGGGKITLVAENNRAWNAYSSVISNNPGGKFTLKSGIIEHLGGTDMAYGIDNLTNGKGTYAETVVNGGTVKSPYRAIRMFLNGIEAQNILTVNAGTIEGTNKSIWMQDPSANANTGTLTVAAEASLIGDANLSVTAGSTSWPVTVSINAAALKDGAEVLSSNVPEGYKVDLVDGCYSVVSTIEKVSSKEELANALANAKPGTIIDATGVTAEPTGSLDTTVIIPAGVTLKGAKFAASSQAYLVIGGIGEDVVFKKCEFVGPGFGMFVIAGNDQDGANMVFEDCEFKGQIAPNFVQNSNGTATFNNCTFTVGSDNIGLVNCMGGTHTFNNCTFDYTGGATFGSNQYVKWNAVNSYSERYSTDVILNGCTRKNCGTQRFGSNSTLTIK